MDFLAAGNKPKVLRTTLYEDQEFTHFELEILHTPLYQRLYDLKQLGYSDRVFPDAVHSRFNHLLGVAEIAERMVDRLVAWLDSRPDEKFAYAFRSSSGSEDECTIDARTLRAHVFDRRPIVRLMALLHDLTHAAFGHTLEDEVSIFKEKHDAPKRQKRFFDALTVQLIQLWAIESGIPGIDYRDLERSHGFDFDETDILKVAAAVFAMDLNHEELHRLAEHLQHLELAFRLLLCLEGAHLNTSSDISKSLAQQDKELICGENLQLLITDVMKQLVKPIPPLQLIVHRDLFLIDIVGNTICADLVDYARRDTSNSGLKVAFDERLLRYLCLVSVRGDLVPGGRPAIRVAMQVFTDKLRHDVLSEMSSLLKARYLISERITFHPTKCAAGACLGTAVQLIGLTDMPGWAQALGDQSFLDLLMRVASGVVAYANEEIFPPSPSNEYQHPLGAAKEPDLLDLDPQGRLEQRIKMLWPTEPKYREILTTCIKQLHREVDAGTMGQNKGVMTRRATAAQQIFWKLRARRYPKLAYRLHGTHSSGRTHTTKVADEYNKPAQRFHLERDIETMCALPLGSVHIHCPLPTTSMKVAHALVVGNDLAQVTHLRSLTKIYDDKAQLIPYQSEIMAIEEMYRSIWRLNIYIDASHSYKRGIVARYAQEILGFANDSLLDNAPDDAPPTQVNEYDVLAGRPRDYAMKDLPRIVRELDQDRMALRHRGEPENLDEKVTAAIERVKMNDHNRS
jgi:HD superfamily phosphohydrolase